MTVSGQNWSYTRLLYRDHCGRNIERSVGEQISKVNYYIHDIHDEADEVILFIRGCFVARTLLEKNPKPDMSVEDLKMFASTSLGLRKPFMMHEHDDGVLCLGLHFLAIAFSNRAFAAEDSQFVEQLQRVCAEHLRRCQILYRKELMLEVPIFHQSVKNCRGVRTLSDSGWKI